jgi:hypothetical protein
MKYNLSSIIIILLVMVSKRGEAQVNYGYDAAGNRTKANLKITILHNDSNSSAKDSNIEGGLSGYNSAVSIYPNPTSQLLVVELKGEYQSSIKIFDLKGQVVYDGHLNKVKTEIDVESLTAGFYIVEIGNNKAGTWKLLKQ